MWNILSKLKIGRFYPEVGIEYLFEIDTNVKY